MRPKLLPEEQDERAAQKPAQYPAEQGQETTREKLQKIHPANGNPDNCKS